MNWVAARDAITKLKEIAANDLGGSADDYVIGDERVYQSSDSSIGLTYAQASQRAMELGGKYSGQEFPDDINPLTQLCPLYTSDAADHPLHVNLTVLRIITTYKNQTSRAID